MADLPPRDTWVSTDDGIAKWRGAVDRISILPLTAGRKLLRLSVDSRDTEMVLLPAQVARLIERLQAPDAE